MAKLDRSLFEQVRNAHWKRKEQDRIAGDAWIMQHGTAAEKREIMGRV